MKFLRKFGPHYAIERFGIMFMSLFLMMCVLTSTIVVSKVRYDTKALSGQAQYTSSFTMSLSGAQGSVLGVYTNDDHTKCFLLLKFQDVSSVPVDANEYQLFLSGCKKDMTYSELKSKPDAMIYQFGATGYLGVYLYSATPFPSQIMNLYLRSTKNITVGKATTQYADETFNKFDQAAIYFNPGGTYATKASFLDEKKWTVFDIYEELISRPAEVAYRNLLRNDLVEMRKQKSLMDEYANRLVKDGMTEPSTPAVIANDSVYAMARTSAQTDDNKEKRFVWSVKQNMWYNADDEKNVLTLTDNDAWLYLDTKVVVPNGYSFNWENGMVKKGYLTQLTGSDSLSDWKKYLDDHKSDANIDDTSFDIESIKWTDTSGNIFTPEASDDDEVDSTSKTARVSQEINQLKTAWQAFYDAKVKYQTTDLQNLLQLEYDAKDIETSYTINTNESGKLITFW